MNRKFSFSAYKKFMTCPKSYDYHYNEKFRPAKPSSALSVGKIIDSIIENILNKEEYDLSELISEYLFTDMEFYDQDLDFDLMDLPDVVKFAEKLGWEGDDIKQALTDMINDQSELSENQFKVLSFACWQSLEMKIQYMMESFEKWILPQFKEVHEVQSQAKEGDLYGLVDFIVTLKDGKKVLLDLKTSKYPYDNDITKATNYPQLALYAAMKGIDYAGFVVLVKTINKNKDKTCKTCDFKTTGGNRKNCPECKTSLEIKMNPTSFSQLLYEEIPKEHKVLTKDSLYDTIKCIDSGVYPRNLNTCQNIYGKPCPYLETCWKTKEKK